MAGCHWKSVDDLDGIPLPGVFHRMYARKGIRKSFSKKDLTAAFVMTRIPNIWSQRQDRGRRSADGELTITN